MLLSVGVGPPANPSEGDDILIFVTGLLLGTGFVESLGGCGVEIGELGVEELGGGSLVGRGDPPGLPDFEEGPGKGELTVEPVEELGSCVEGDPEVGTVGSGLGW